MAHPQLNLPPLSPRYEAALLAAAEFIFREFEPFAIIASGSIIRGNPDPSSDFDLLVLHEHPWRRRVQKWFESVPAEIFVNSTDRMESYLRKEGAEGRPVMAHMLTTGAILYSSSPKTDEIVQKAHRSLEKGPGFSEASLERQRYAAACLFEDALEVASRDATTATLILARAVEATARYWFASHQRFSVRSKEQLNVIRAEDLHTAHLIEQALSPSAITLRMIAARELALRVIGHAGFFEWDSGVTEETAR